MVEEKYNNVKLGERGAIISIVAYICLSILKLAIGYISNSTALKADGLNNTTDIIASLAVLIGLKMSQRPPDKNHKYGHWKSETIASMIASFIMVAVGLQVLIDAIVTMVQGEKSSPDIVAAYVGIFSAVVMYMVYHYNKKLATKINSSSVMAAAKDNISDAWVSIGTAIGILGAQMHMPWLDTVTAIIIGLLICKTAWHIFKQASHELSDGFDPEKITIYRNVISQVKGVKNVKEIRGRYYGNNEVLDVVILVSATLVVKEAHDITDYIERLLLNEYGIHDVHVHVEPNESTQLQQLKS